MSVLRPKDAEEKKEMKEKALEGIKQVLKMSQKYATFCDTKMAEALNNRAGKKVIRMIEKQNAKSEQDKETPTEVNLKYFTGTLRDYQVEGFFWLKTLYEHCLNGILADEMGLGKTVQVIALLAYLYERRVSGPFLIVVPLSTLPNWRSELERFAPALPVVVFYALKDERPALLRQLRQPCYLDGRKVEPIVVTTTTMINKEMDTFERPKWKYMVFDEAQKIKNHNSVVSREMRHLNCANKLLLTGTPLQNNLEELWSLLNFLMPRIFNKIEMFAPLLFLDDLHDEKHLVEEEQTNKIISTIHNVLDPFMLRRMKCDVLFDIVPKKEVILYCPLTKYQKDMYRNVLEKNIESLGGNENRIEIYEDGARPKRRCTQRGYYKFEKDEVIINESNILNELNELEELKNINKKVITRNDGTHYVPVLTMSGGRTDQVMCRKVVSHPYLVHVPVTADGKEPIFDKKKIISESGKMMVLDLMLKELKQDNHKVLFFSTFTMVLDIMEEYLTMKNYDYCRLDGATDLETRENVIKKFNEDPNLFIFLISTRAGGVGLNLTGADTVIFFNRDWNPQVDLQAQDRCHRIGQTKPVMIYSLVTKNTIDEIIMERCVAKRRLEKVVIKQGRFKSSVRTNEDIDVVQLQRMLAVDESEKVIAKEQIFSDQELKQFLDRSELYQQLESMKAKVDNKENIDKN